MTRSRFFIGTFARRSDGPELSEVIHEQARHNRPDIPLADGYHWAVDISWGSTGATAFWVVKPTGSGLGMVPEALSAFSAWTADQWRKALRPDTTVAKIVALSEASDLGAQLGQFEWAGPGMQPPNPTTCAGGQPWQQPHLAMLGSDFCRMHAGQTPS